MFNLKPDPQLDRLLAELKTIELPAAVLDSVRQVKPAGQSVQGRNNTLYRVNARLRRCLKPGPAIDQLIGYLSQKYTVALPEQVVRASIRPYGT